ncbi:GNAT family N-acetyltransferase [Lysinibacillus sp. NPDC097195]|uniref:GNAT family N-acetyltransferase n=1 Tax=Lysinibacillus sp. NPDC097195 TaxID=3364141 RepID=UPI0037FC9184
MFATIEKALDIEELAQFLAEMNKQKTSHIGYCGDEAEEILQTLQADFIAKDGTINFIIARNHEGAIIAAIGIDMDDASAEVWGPFNQTGSSDLQQRLWQQLVSVYPTVQSYYFFINHQNLQQQAFMDALNAQKSGEHFVLEIKENAFNKVSEIKSEPFKQSDFSQFETLHAETFPGTYYDAATIIERLSANRILKVLKNESDDLQGYAYFEVNSEMAEASLEYLAIAQNAQNQGLGTMLLQEVLTEMFAYVHIHHITLCVDNTNSQANHLYFKAGFTAQDILVSYALRI